MNNFKDDKADILFSQTEESGAGYPQTKKFSLPQKVSLALLLFFLMIFVFLLLSEKRGNLLNKISKETSAYLSLNLNGNEPLFFWQKRASGRTAEIDKIWQLFFSENENEEFWRKIKPYLSGKFELASLPGGDFVFSATLKNKKEFLNNEQKIFSDNSGAPQPVFREIEKDHLTVSSVYNWQAQKTGAGLERELKKYLTVNDQVALYVSRAGGLARIINENFQLFLSELDLPFLLIGKEEGDFLVFAAGTPKQNNLRSALVDSSLPENVSENNLFLHTHYPDAAFYNWLDKLAGRDKNAASAVGMTKNLASQFYNFNFNEILGTGATAEVFLFFKQQAGDNYWAAIFRAAEKASEEALMRSLSELGTRLFAISHPTRTERVLSDNTVITELRAETDGLQWENLNLSNEPFANSEFKFLRGQGEKAGIFLGKFDEGNIAIANSLDFFLDNLKFYKEFNQGNSISDIYFRPQNSNLLEFTSWQEIKKGLWSGKVMFRP